MPTRRLNTHFSQKAAACTPALPKRKAGNPYANIRQVLVIAIMVMMVAAMIVIVVIVVITIMVVAVIICRSGRRRDRAEQQS
jgi:heme/copper-type cytochrome/quinol oxidase subunit 2